MAARKFTELGMGPVRKNGAPRASAVGFVSDALRDTVPAPNNNSKSKSGKSKSGDDEVVAASRRHFTLEGGLHTREKNERETEKNEKIEEKNGKNESGKVPPNSKRPSMPPISTPRPSPTSAARQGRYSSQPTEDEIVSSPPPATSTAPKDTLRQAAAASKDTLRRAARQALRVDQVGSTSIVAPKESSLKPHIVDRKRISQTQLTSREAFVLALIDGRLTPQDLVDVSGMPEREVATILTRLVDVGIVSR